MIDTCQAASMYEKFYSPNVLVKIQFDTFTLAFFFIKYVRWPSVTFDNYIESDLKTKQLITRNIWKLGFSGSGVQSQASHITKMIMVHTGSVVGCSYLKNFA